jgi:L-2,4-diaminobutyrate decarboxylase
MAIEKSDRRILDAYDAETFRKTGHQIVDLLAHYLKQSSSRRIDSVLPNVSPAQMLDRWPGTFPEKPGADIIALMEKTIAESNHLHHPHYIGHQVTAPLPLAALCEFAGSLLNNATAVYEMGPVNTAMEKRLVQWMARCIGYTDTADGIFTSGGTLGNLTALLAARQAKSGYDIWTKGIDSAQQLTILISEESHYSVKRAAGIMGLGEDAVVPIPVDENYRMDIHALRKCHAECLHKGRKVFAVAAGACSTATGTFDDLEAVADFCGKNDLWLHVDGAHGASALLSGKYRHLLKGIHRADSIVWDAHKMLLMPALVTAVLFRDGARSFEPFSQKASYLFEKEARQEWYNFAQRTMECTKIMMGMRLFIPLMVYGTEFFADYVTSRIDCAKQFAQAIRETADFETAVEPQCNIVCFRYRKPGCQDLDNLQKIIRRKLLESEQFYIVQTRLKTGFYLRCTILNPLTTLQDLLDLLEAIRSIAGRL